MAAAGSLIPAVSEGKKAPGAAQTPKMADFQFVKQTRFFVTKPTCSHVHARSYSTDSSAAPHRQGAQAATSDWQTPPHRGPIGPYPWLYFGSEFHFC